MPEGSACWAGLLWVRDTAGNITSMANFLSKQLRLFRLAHKITARRGVNNGTVWCKRNFDCVFHKLSRPVSSLYRTKEANHPFFPLNLLVLLGKKEWQTLCHLKWRRSSLLQPERNHPSDSQRFRDYTSPRSHLCRHRPHICQSFKSIS